MSGSGARISIRYPIDSPGVQIGYGCRPPGGRVGARGTKVRVQSGLSVLPAGNRTAGHSLDPAAPFVREIGAALPGNKGCRGRSHMGVEVTVEGLTKSFGKQVIWGDVTLTLPPGEISVMLGPSGTGKSVFLKTLVGLLKPDRGSVFIRDVNLARCSEHQLYETRKLFGVLFQDGALFGSMNLYDNIAFPLREHTRKSESEIKQIVTEKLEMVGLTGTEKKLPGEISGGMRKRAGL